jgi:DNA-binding transcriptional ArsR family regulator
MPEPDLGLDRLVHEPARLAILTVLSAASDADFLFLQRATGLTKGNLSSHLGRLEAAGLVEVEKRFVGRKPNTRLRLTQEGRERIARHWDQLDRLRGTARRASRAPRAAPQGSS